MQLRGGKRVAGAPVAPVARRLADWETDERRGEWVDWICVAAVVGVLAVYLSALVGLRYVGHDE